jgi:molybdopterin-guanine dinucleotide biosynthesis protein A
MSGQPAAAGILLLTGGLGRRFGAPKHLQSHPAGGTWGGRLVAVFEAVFPGGPVQLLGEPLPDRPGLAVLDDPRQGPAVALRHWARVASAAPVRPRRWWFVACDQIRWTPSSLAAWAETAAGADPGASHWVLARHGGRVQPLGGWIAGTLVEALADTPGPSLMALADALPCLILDSPHPAGCEHPGSLGSLSKRGLTGIRWPGAAGPPKLETQSFEVP